MIRTVEAIIDEKGRVSLLEPVRPSTARRALVTILEEEPIAETALLSPLRRPDGQPTAARRLSPCVSGPPCPAHVVHRGRDRGMAL
jgi:hypothetical protein